MSANKPHTWPGLATGIQCQAGGPVDPAALRIEQRLAPRYTLLLRQAKLRTRHGEFVCILRDLSETGISIRIFHPLPPGDRLAIELREGCPYLVEKVWEGEGEAGFRFRDRVALEEILQDDALYPRRPLRVALELPLVMASGADRGQAVLGNLSQQGARLDADREWARDQLVRLTIAGLPAIHAKIRWRRELSHGLVFEDRFSFRGFALALGRLQGIV
ncbi:PilZ domain-containing protein [Erythrobacter sp. SDW2]|uniref:PilZ domain-containing protein n=1 Tax=Erythrobacter sp. SDW2 TaxID=2907154 RepID=UPI001F3BC5AB|nr:PilZ domain-containing protein [Erythrobacter sp. SDW2]UIP07216.1 PilZ domain-containing protein [Erythrobacter sp. SDW2]